MNGLEAQRLAPVAQADGPDISVVVPVVAIHDDPVVIYDAFAAEVRKLGKTCEFVFVLDGDKEEAARSLAALRQKAPEVRAYRLGRAFGESMALSVGFRRARGRVVVTVSPYIQADPAELGKLLGALTDNVDIVVTCRSPRVDSIFNRLQSAAFHLAVSGITGTRFNDISCGLRAMRNEVARQITLYGDQHRFLPLLAARDGFRVIEINVRQSPQERRWRVFGPVTYLSRILDMMTVFFLIRFTKRPLRFFGSLGAGIFSVGFLICVWLSLVKILYHQPLTERPLLLLGVLMLVLGIQTASIGLLGEIIIFTKGQETRDYRAKEITG